MAAYSLYELFHIMIDRVGWRNESEQRAAHASVTEAENMNILGNLTKQSACRHEHVLRKFGQAGRCEDCGRSDIT